MQPDFRVSNAERTAYNDARTAAYTAKIDAQGEFDRDKRAAAAVYAAEAACDTALAGAVGTADVQYVWTLYGAAELTLLARAGDNAADAFGHDGAYIAWSRLIAAAERTFAEAENTAAAQREAGEADRDAQYAFDEAASLAGAMDGLAAAHPSPWATAAAGKADAYCDELDALDFAGLDPQAPLPLFLAAHDG